MSTDKMSELEEIVAQPPTSWPQPRQDAVAALLERIKTGKIPEEYKEVRAAEKIKESEFYETRKEAEVIFEKGEPIELAPTMIRAMEEQPEIFALRFLMARQMHVGDAAKMVITASRYRISHQLDTKPLFPTYLPIQGWTEEELRASRGVPGDRPSDELDRRAAMGKSVYSAGWHKTDKFGCPLWMERTGKGKARELYELNQKINPPGANLAALADAARPAHIHNAEVGLAILQCENDRRKLKGLPPVFQISMIRDLSGLSMGTIYNPTINFFREVARYDKERAGEGIARIYIVNAPAVFTVVWSMIKLWLEERIIKKVQIVKPHETTKTLLETIDEENLPEFLGGTCTCGGPSLADQKAADSAAAADDQAKKLDCLCLPDLAEQPDATEDSDLAETQLVTVKAGKVGTVEFDIKRPEETIVWEYAVDGTGDVQFKAEYQPSGEEPVSIAIAGEEAMAQYGITPKTVKGSGSFTSPTTASPTTAEGKDKIVFSFDNSYSWVKGKTVQFRVTRADAATDALEKTEPKEE